MATLLPSSQILLAQDVVPQLPVTLFDMVLALVGSSSLEHAGSWPSPKTARTAFAHLRRSDCHKMQCQNVPSHSSNSGLASGGSRGKSGRLDTDSCRHTSAGNALHPLRFLAPKKGASLETPILVHNDFTMAAICRKNASPHGRESRVANPTTFHQLHVLVC